MKPAYPSRSVLLKLEKLPSRNRMLVGTSGESGFSLSCRNTVAVRVKEGAGVEVGLPLVNRNVSHIQDASSRLTLTGVEMPSTI